MGLGTSTIRLPLLTVVVLLAVGAPVTAATPVVSPHGTDGNPGTDAAPFRTLAKAASVAHAGDTVIVKAGTYEGNVSIAQSGTPENPIVFKTSGKVLVAGRIEQKRGFRPVDGEQGTFMVEDPGPVAAVAIDLDTTNIVLNGMDAVGRVNDVAAGNYRYCFDNHVGKLYLRYAGENPEKDHTIHVLRDVRGFSIAGSNVVLDGFAISGFSHHGVEIGGGKNVTVKHCRISLCGFPWGGAINLYNTNQAKIEDCVLHRVMNGIVLTQAAGTLITHNTIHRTRAHGIILSEGAGNAIRNNLLFAGGPSGNALYVHADAAAGLALDYNCYLDYLNSILISWMPLEGRYPTFWDYRADIQGQDTHSISDDPLFISTIHGMEDFRLNPDSPCKGKPEDGTDIGARLPD
ncbi:MAG: hypothetical protein AUJ92_01250 [Armatimonadetes bacterium CG2_30_59_28]|nr:DUF1565 domain-containing protein [Armatimonadota bacterium]OIO98484.1 MAG: hypothetical protein AUJ92_01250 [Armatimonadetes bacterium CG2_30_59_28]PIU65519.1 MAG: hypothetical protein COS85_08485 [Armatimonadetes bacterium CG07_land_8_20_14_0_80_59_28]